jgi:hypothetical protein
MSQQTQVKVSIPSEKLNDFKFIYDTLIDAKLSILKTISNQTKNPMEQLVSEFMPELKDYDRIDILEKYGLNAQATAVTQPVVPVDLNPHLDMDEKYNEPKPVEEPKPKRIINRKPTATPGYKVFLEKQRELVIKNNPGVSINEVPHLLDNAWKALTKKDKDDYENMAKHSSPTLSTLPANPVEPKAPVVTNIPTPIIPPATIVKAIEETKPATKKVIIVKKNLPAVPKESVVQEPAQVTNILTQVEEKVKTITNNLETQREQIAKVSNAVSNATAALDRANKALKKIIIVKKNLPAVVPVVAQTP